MVCLQLPATLMLALMDRDTPATEPTPFILPDEAEPEDSTHPLTYFPLDDDPHTNED